MGLRIREPETWSVARISTSAKPSAGDVLLADGMVRIGLTRMDLPNISPAESRSHGTVMGHDHQVLGHAVLVLDAAGENRLGAKPQAVEKL